MDKNKRKKMLHLFGKTAIDFSKLIFASIVLGSILSSGFTATILIVFGLVSCLLVLLIGIFLVINSDIKQEE